MNYNRWLIVLAVSAVAVTGVARAAIADKQPSPAQPAAQDGVVTDRAAASLATSSVAATASLTQASVTTPVAQAPAPPARPSASSKRPKLPAAAARTAAVGDTVRFGSFGGEALAWRILSIDAKRVVLLSEAALTAGPYQSDEYAADPSDYARSSVRAWLRDTFVPAAFGADAADDPAIGRSSASDAVAGDIAYLLTASQVERYLPEADDRVAVSAEIAQTDAGYGGSTLAAGPVYWWLAADPGLGAGNVVPVVQTNGGLNRYRYAAIPTDGVRPATKLNTAAISLVPVAGASGTFTVRAR